MIDFHSGYSGPTLLIRIWFLGTCMTHSKHDKILKWQHRVNFMPLIHIEVSTNYAEILFFLLLLLLLLLLLAMAFINNPNPNPIKMRSWDLHFCIRKFFVLYIQTLRSRFPGFNCVKVNGTPLIRQNNRNFFRSLRKISSVISRSCSTLVPY